MKMNRIMKMIAIAAMTLLLPLWADAQEKTIEVQNLRDVTSIVRETKDGLWLVCNNSYAQSRFTLVDETQTTAPQLELGYITGTDTLNVIKESKPLDVTAPGSELKMRELRSFDLEKPLRMICE